MNEAFPEKTLKVEEKPRIYKKSSESFRNIELIFR